MSRLAPLAIAVCACAVTLQSGCVSPRTPGILTQGRAGFATTDRSADVVGYAELSTITAATAYDAVAQLRPAFLSGDGVRLAGRTSAETIVVFLDGTRQGSLESLHAIPAQLVREIRYLSPAQAARVFGQGYYGTGAILVSSR